MNTVTIQAKLKRSIKRFFLKVQNELLSIRIDVQEDIINEGKQNPQVAETEILLYDIYVSEQIHC